MQDSASFWTDIQKLEEQLSKAPGSFCFAGLSTVYLKVGLIDDALHMAREGVAKHPDYLAGQRALALACHAKGLNDEALASLQRIVVALPEDVQSQKLLGRLLVEAGKQESALQVYRTVLEFDPEDVECRLQLESLERLTRATESAFMSDEGDEDDEEIIEDLEILDEFDEEYSETEHLSSETRHDPLSTATLAELYVTQGYVKKALEIYRAIQDDNPVDRTINERITELEALNAGVTESVLVPAVPLQGTSDNALATLDGWLENIRRIKSCRSEIH